MNNSTFDGDNCKVKFIIHGYRSGYEEDGWMDQMKNMFIKDKPFGYNIFIVDWPRGAYSMNYYKAANDTQIVGRAISDFIMRLLHYTLAESLNIHLIGHSLGAHIAGFAGKSLQLENHDIGRITGLDPAGPNFRSTTKLFRLDRDDALYVEVIHTSIGGLFEKGYGIAQPIGDYDFYFNNGADQPHCSPFELPSNIMTNSLVPGFVKTYTCNHVFAYVVLILNSENLQDCQLVGIQCNSFSDFISGVCNDCGNDGEKCAVITLFGSDDRVVGQRFRKQYNEIFTRKNTTFFLATRSEPPYCAHHYSIEIELAGNSDQPAGSFNLKLEGKFFNVTRSVNIKRGWSMVKGVGKSWVFLDKVLGKEMKATMDLSDSWNLSNIFFTRKIIINRLILKYLSNSNSRVREERSAIMCPEQSDKKKIINFIPCHDEVNRRLSKSRTPNDHKSEILDNRGNRAVV